MPHQLPNTSQGWVEQYDTGHKSLTRPPNSPYPNAIEHSWEMSEPCMKQNPIKPKRSTAKVPVLGTTATQHSLTSVYVLRHSQSSPREKACLLCLPVVSVADGYLCLFVRKTVATLPVEKKNTKSVMEIHGGLKSQTF